MYTLIRTKYQSVAEGKLKTFPKKKSHLSDNNLFFLPAFFLFIPTIMIFLHLPKMGTYKACG